MQTITIDTIANLGGTALAVTVLLVGAKWIATRFEKKDDALLDIAMKFNDTSHEFAQSHRENASAIKDLTMAIRDHRRDHRLMSEKDKT